MPSSGRSRLSTQHQVRILFSPKIHSFIRWCERDGRWVILQWFLLLCYSVAKMNATTFCIGQTDKAYAPVYSVAERLLFVGFCPKLSHHLNHFHWFSFSSLLSHAAAGSSCYAPLSPSWNDQRMYIVYIVRSCFTPSVAFILYSRSLSIYMCVYHTTQFYVCNIYKYCNDVEVLAKVKCERVQDLNINYV